MRHVDVLRLCENGAASTKSGSEQCRPPKSIRVIKYICKSQPYQGYMMKNDLLYKILNKREIITVPEAMEIEIIKEIHEQGHYAVKKQKTW